MNARHSLIIQNNRKESISSIEFLRVSYGVSGWFCQYQGVLIIITESPMVYCYSEAVISLGERKARENHTQHHLPLFSYFS